MASTQASNMIGFFILLFIKQANGMQFFVGCDDGEEIGGLWAGGEIYAVASVAFGQ
jgi:hypothetical protein